MSKNIHSGCYCCGVTPSARMDIDAALDELGMLSSVTESRKQYMQERMRTRSESALITKRQMYPKSHSLPASSASSSYQIVHLDTKYITGFTDTPNPEDMKSSIRQLPQSSTDEVFVDYSKDYRTQQENMDSAAEQRRKMRLKFKREDISARNRRLLARKRAKQPYEVPWRLTQSFQDSLLSRSDDIPESKSNSSSPVKPLNPESLTRSRSLDNIDFSAFFISENRDRQDIDNVASGLKNLNFSDT
ncbi:uncharacterized protein LOC123540425 [Mercenaria mercenaria]|uniref:uncharacterized protein LOC123540425 n=1 Tax=Mercenaria mercenaria TaxID=6596 RepID=UPI00234F74BD|nr:uncharacterized protein LOC123540425 [Mercenaria mercenaria]